jgi:hypothetical protein
VNISLKGHHPEKKKKKRENFSSRLLRENLFKMLFGFLYFVRERKKEQVKLIEIDQIKKISPANVFLIISIVIYIYQYLLEEEKKNFFM